MSKNYFLNLKRTLVIAEIGVNHNGSLDLAKKMIEAAKKTGADAVKFQTFSANRLVSINTPKVKYQINKNNKFETHFDMLKKLELSEQDHIELKNYCRRIQIIFLSTPYDIESAKFLLGLNIKMFKISSADLIDISLHNWISKTKKPTIISVGMSSVDEIKETLYEYKKNNNNNICLLHCVSNYPCSDHSLNLNVMNMLKNKFSLPIGFSDHSIGSEASILSIALGSKVIEKHFTLDKKLPGPDQAASSNPHEFTQLVSSIRRAETMLGSDQKKCQPEEKEMLKVSRKSICISSPIKSNQLISLSDLELKRPGTGLPPKYIGKIIGKKSKKNLKVGYLIKLSDIYE